MKRVGEKMDIKITLVGAHAVGKSALLVRFRTGIFSTDIQSTIGAHYANAERVSRDGRAVIKVNVWDTAGMERFRSLVPMYIRGATIVFICFDTCRIQEIREHIATVRQVNEECEIVFVQTKIDDMSANKASYREGEDVEAYAKDKGYRLYKTSAKSGTGVDLLFEECIERCYTIKRGYEPDSDVKDGTVDVKDDGYFLNSKSYTASVAGACCNLM